MQCLNMGMDHTQPHPELYNVPFTTDSFNGMPYRTLGRSGLRVSNVGLGTWKFGYPDTGDGARVDDKTALRIFDRALDLGVTFWDTTHVSSRFGHVAQRVEQEQRLTRVAPRVRTRVDPGIVIAAGGGVLMVFGAVIDRLLFDVEEQIVEDED